MGECAVNSSSPTREQAKKVMKHAAVERRNIEKDLQTSRNLYQKTAVKWIDTLELLEGIVEAFEQSQDSSSLASGVAIVVEQAWEHLAAVDVCLDGTRDELFDSSRHECIKELNDNSLPDGAVLRVLRRGIVCNGQRLRSAQVVVNRRRST
jgi:molecular chaperone GrpE (heat shock protein)